MIVPFAAGGSADVIGQRIADGLRSMLGQSLVVDNRAAPAARSVAARSRRLRPTATPSAWARRRRCNQSGSLQEPAV
jgi:hypothetical protein